MKPALKFFILFLLLAALAPYFIICFYALPFADDFCFGWTASQNISFLQKFLNQYLLWNGRYTADVLVNLHPLVTGKIINYQLTIFVSLLATPGAIYFLVSELLRDSLTKAKPRFLSLLVSLFITLFYLNYQPNVTEGVYWFIGISNYHLGNLLFIIQLTLLLKSFYASGRAKISLRLFSFLLLIMAIGFNEIGALLFPLFYFTLALFNFRSVDRKLFIVYGIVSMAASAFVFFSPGNFVRSKEFTNRFDLLYSLVYSLAQTTRFLSEWMLNIPFIGLSVVVVTNAHNIRNRLVSAIDYRLILAALVFVVFAGSFLPYFATGMLGQHRTINFVFFFFILLWILFMVSVSQKFALYAKWLSMHNEKKIAVLLAATIFLMAVTHNGIKIIHDFSNDNFGKYKTAFIERQQTMIKNPEARYLPLKAMPVTFSIVDVHIDSTWWVETCMRKYYLETKMELK